MANDENNQPNDIHNTESQRKTQPALEHPADDMTELNKALEELEQLRKHVVNVDQLQRDLADARNRPFKSFKRKQLSRLLFWLSERDKWFSESRRSRFMTSAEKRDPKRSLKHIERESCTKQPHRNQGHTNLLDWRSDKVRTSDQNAASKSAPQFDKTVMVVSHDASRTGAPFLALNLVRELSKRYNVVTVVLGNGDLAVDFAASSVSLFEIDRMTTRPDKISQIVEEICKAQEISMAFVNSVESRAALVGLKSAGVPSVALLHEFAAYTRPSSAFPDVFANADQVVFSTDITLDNALGKPGFERPVNVHVLPQGKCETRSTEHVPDKVEEAWVNSVLRPKGPKDDTFVVIGAGTIETRKGIDLFIEVATRLITGPGGGRFRFVWFGKGFDPENDVHRSVYLADQIERAGIQTQMKIVRSTTEIEHVYHSADLMLLSSRLDPLPNVAIDMLVAGKPIVCFERTTGIASLLASAGLKDTCVANFIDTSEMAHKIRALSEDSQLLTEVVEKSQELAARNFDFSNYTLRLEELARLGGKKSDMIAEDADRLMASGAFRSDFYRSPFEKNGNERQNIKDYLAANKSGTKLRKPAPGFNQLIYAEENGWGQPRDPFVAFIESGEPEGRWKADVIDENSPIDDAVLRRQKIALHIHAFFPDELENILNRIGANQTNPVLFVSAPSDQMNAVDKVLKSYVGNVGALQSVQNRGRDVAPFLTEFGEKMVSEFDIIGHLHTKKSTEIKDRQSVENWVEFLMQNTVGGSSGGAMLDRIVTAMARSPDVGIVYPDDPHHIGWATNRAIADQLAKRLGISALPRQIDFPMGTMFWARSELIEKFVSLRLDWKDYPAEPLPVDGTMLHAIERLFGVAPAYFGMRTNVTNVRGLTR